VPQTSPNGYYDYTALAWLSLEKCVSCCPMPGARPRRAVVGNASCGHDGSLQAGRSRRVVEVVSDTRGAHGSVDSSVSMAAP